MPGPFSLAATAANCSREISDALHQQWQFALNLNKVNMGDQLASMSYIHDVKSVSEHLEEVTVSTLGLKNASRDILSEL